MFSLNTPPLNTLIRFDLSIIKFSTRKTEVWLHKGGSKASSSSAERYKKAADSLYPAINCRMACISLALIWHCVSTLGLGSAGTPFSVNQHNSQWKMWPYKTHFDNLNWRWLSSQLQTKGIGLGSRTILTNKGFLSSLYFDKIIICTYSYKIENAGLWCCK